MSLSKSFVYSSLFCLSFAVTAAAQIKQPGKPDQPPQVTPPTPAVATCEIRVHGDYSKWRIVRIADNNEQVLGETQTSVYGGSNAEGFNAILDAAKKLTDLGLCATYVFRSGF